MKIKNKYSKNHVMHLVREHNMKIESEQDSINNMRKYCVGGGFVGTVILMEKGLFALGAALLIYHGYSNFIYKFGEGKRFEGVILSLTNCEREKSALREILRLRHDEKSASIELDKLF